MNEFNNTDPYTTKVEEVTCRMCEKVFLIDVQYGKDGLPRFFRPKYCNECNAKLSKPIISNSNECSTVAMNGSIINSGTIQQKNVEGLVDYLEDHYQKLEVLLYANDKIEKQIEHIGVVEMHQKDLNSLQKDQIGHLSEFEKKQAYLNLDQSKFNLQIANHIDKLAKEHIIVFSIIIILFIIDLMAIWYIIRK